MPAWVMTSRQMPDYGKGFYVGALLVARISKGWVRGSRPYELQTLGGSTYHETFSDALREMHRQLKSPPEEQG